MKKLLVAAIVVLMASPAFAAIQNVKVSGDITSTFIDRNNFDLGVTGTVAEPNGLGGTTSVNEPLGLKKQNVFITQTRIRVDADLSDNVSTTVGLLNERAWNSEQSIPGGGTNGVIGGDNTMVDIYLASVTMRELLYSPLTVTVGRQEFYYGNGLILGQGGVNNQSTGALGNIAQDFTDATTYDGVKAVLDYKPLTIDMFYFKNGQTSKSLSGLYTASKNQSSDVYGLNANYQLSDPMNTVVEGYLFTRFDGKGFQSPNSFDNGVSNINDKNNSLYVPGLRASTNPIKGLNVQGEFAWQLGQIVTQGTSINQEAERRNAMAAQALATYSLPVLEKYKPSVNASYTYVSGDKNGTVQNGNNGGGKKGKTYSAWDSFNEAQGGGTIYNTLYPLSNMNIIAVGASVNPLEDVTTAFTWSNLWAADKYSTNNPLDIYQPNSGNVSLGGVTGIQYVPGPGSKKDARGLGNEYDVNVTYNYTEDVTFGVSLGWYVPGSALAIANRSTASQALADLAVKF